MSAALEARVAALEAEIASLKSLHAKPEAIPPPFPVAPAPAPEKDAVGHDDAPVPLPAPVTADVPVAKASGKFEPNYDHQVTSFELMGLKPELVAALRENGYTKPTALQSVALVPIIRGRNVLVQGPADAGRIISYALAALQLVDPSRKHCQALILAANKERAVRIAKAVRVLGGEESASRPGMTPKVYACVAGTSTVTDIEALSRRPQIVVGTPGRVFHLLDREHLSTSHLKVMICDEADDLLSTFKQLVGEIRRILPDNPLFQTVFAADNFPEGPLALALKHAHAPTMVQVRTQDGVYRVVQATHKLQEDENSHPYR